MPRVPHCLLFLLFACSVLQAQTLLNERVLVVYNTDVPESKQVAEYYLAKRAISKTHLCKIDPLSPEQIDQHEFDSSVKKPIQKCLERLGKDAILYIVFSYQTPYLVQIGPKVNALDQFIADIWDEYLPERTANQGDVQPYFGGAQRQGGVYQPYVSLADYRHQPNARMIYSVWRLDTPSVALAKGLVDKALYAEAHGLTGIACFDRNRGNIAGVADFGYGAGDWEIYRAADFARRAGFTVIEDDHQEEFGTAPAPLRCDHAALYTGWYALGHYNDAFSWNPGAIGIHLDSASASNPRKGTNWAVNAVSRGITITAGATDEPYLENLPRPDQTFLYLFQGANAGDALLRGERLLKWNIINIGDPLYRPFPKPPVANAQLAPPLVFALLPQVTLADTKSEAGIAVSRVLSEDVAFSVTSNDRAQVTVPPNVTIPAGHIGVKFPIETHRVSGDPAMIQLHVNAKGYEASNTLILLPTLAALSIGPEKVKGGSPATGTLVLRRAASGSAKATFKSSNSAIVKIPAELTIPQGQNNVPFSVATQPVHAETSVEISATYDGVVRSATLKIIP